MVVGSMNVNHLSSYITIYVVSLVLNFHVIYLFQYVWIICKMFVQITFCPDSISVEDSGVILHTGVYNLSEKQFI